MLYKLVIILIIAFVVLIVIVPFLLQMAGINIVELGGARTPGMGGVLIRSDDGAATWRNAAITENPSASFPAQIFTFAFHPANPDVLYLGGKASGLWKSTTQGVSWSKVEVAPGSLDAGADVYKIAVNTARPNIMYVAAYQNRRGRVFKSQDAGASFQEMYLLPSDRYAIFDLFLHPQDENLVMIGTGAGGLLETRDGGATWRVIHWFTDSITQIAVDPADSNRIYVGVEIGRAHV